MEGISKYLRLRTLAVAALVAAGLVLIAMFASASARIVIVKDISLGIRNSSKALIQVQVCTNLHVSSRYEDGLTPDPCGPIDHTYILRAGERTFISNANPVGVIITNYIPNSSGPAKDKTLYFLARNRLFERPYFRAQGHKVALSEGEAVLRDVNGVGVELRRYHDEDRDGESVKLMRIEIRSWPGTV